MNIWRYLDRLPVGPHGGGILIGALAVAIALDVTAYLLLGWFGVIAVHIISTGILVTAGAFD